MYIDEKLWYFAHPYSSDPKTNVILCIKRSKLLLDNGLHIFSPIVHSDPIAKLTEYTEYEDWMGLDLNILVRCDGLILAPKWEDSNGCNTERKTAEENDLIIKEYNKILEELT